MVGRILKMEDVEMIFGYPDSPIIDGAAEAGIRPILSRQERVAVHMADAYTRTTSGRKIGVVFTQYGPGIENAFGGIAQAFGDSVPILVLACGYARPVWNFPHHFNSSMTARPITKMSERIESVSMVGPVLERAFTQVRNGRRAPVLLEIPIDLLRGEWSGELDYRATTAYRCGPDPKAVEEVAERLIKAKQPLIYAGQGIHYAEAWQELRELAELLDAPVTTNRLPLSNGERAEILLDLTGMEGDSLLLMSYGSELPATVPGSSYILWESSALNGIDFPVLRIRVGSPTIDPVTTFPASLVPVDAYDEADATNTRTKVLSGTGMVGMGMFYINGGMFDMDVINDTIMLGATEIWEIQNNSNMAHPMHIHGGSCYVLDRGGDEPPAWEQGAKDVVLVDAGETVRVIMKFEDLTDGWPFMYHCHNLMHIEEMMWQFVIVDPSTDVVEQASTEEVRVFPVPASSMVTYHAPFPVRRVRVIDPSGREVINASGSMTTDGSIDMASLVPGMYIAWLEGPGGPARVRVVRE